ncbi:hypothetical protein [Massilia sp. TS11]|uniref:hypothetical protein n=1 Tax=Massilia sp. TS11 TaxID=2908003 RepID=UPI001EDC845D|nr:hypothetical protein [Massilia sp. TS11]MCG2586107.1 hypothetical protein [Massilia sp. TS11]
MSTQTKSESCDVVVQEHHIDLPGETVECWIRGSTGKLKVILRKHRDVVFDIHLGNGKSYTLEATESDFYNARDKKIVLAAQHAKVMFKDGERMHVWVSRNFRGSLLVKCDGHLVSNVTPNEWDKHCHSDDPKEKPVPLIVAIANPAPAAKSTAIENVSRSASQPEEVQSVHIQEVSKEGAPPWLIRWIGEGGESLHLDPDDIITRNWIIAQLAGTGGYVFDNHAWIKELIGCRFHLQRVVHKSGPKIYLVFNGNSKLRELMSATKYGLKHAKVMKITGGAGGVKQAWDTAKGAAKDSMKAFAQEEGRMVVKGAGVAVFFAIALDTAEWYKDYVEIDEHGNHRKDFCDLLAKIGTDLVKAGLAAALTTASVAAIFGIATMLGATIAAPVVLVVAGTIAISVAWAFGVDKLDKAVSHALGESDTTSWLAKKFRETAEYLSRSTKDLRYTDYPRIQMVR